MDNQLEEINSGYNTRLIAPIGKTVLDFAKYLKNDDSVFDLSSLSEFTPRILDAMNSHVQVMRKNHALDDAYKKMYREIRASWDDEPSDYFDWNEYGKNFDKLIAQELKKAETGPQSRLVEDLRKITNTQQTQGEEIVVEAPILQIPKDPITKKDIKFAVRSRRCKHVYDKESIENFITTSLANNRPRIRCPIAGCTNSDLSIDDLENDDETNNLIESV